MTIRWQYQVVAAPPPGALDAPAETVTLDKWYQPLSTPTRRPARRDSGWVGYPPATEAETVTVDRWSPVWGMRRLPPRRPVGFGVQPVDSPSAVEDVTLDKWAGPLSGPVPRKRGRDPGWHSSPIEPTLFTTPVVDWLRPTETPTQPKPRVLFRLGFTARPGEPTVWVEPTTTTPAPDVPNPPWVNATYPNLKRWTSVDCDALEGFQKRWFAEGLHTVIPHVYTDDLPANLTLPYAQIESRKLKAPEYQAAVITPGDDYLDYRRVTISILGVGKKTVGDLMGTVMGIYSFRLFDVPNSQMRACWFAGEEVIQEQNSKWGNRVWKGVIEYEVWLVRVLP